MQNMRELNKFRVGSTPISNPKTINIHNNLKQAIDEARHSRMSEAAKESEAKKVKPRKKVIRKPTFEERSKLLVGAL